METYATSDLVDAILAYRADARCGLCGQKTDGTHRKRCDACVAKTRHERKRRERRLRRNALRGTLSEPYTLAEIAGRDGRRCGLCRRSVRMELVVPDHWAPTIDHLIPISAGGDDVPANVQLAHFICNARRKAGGVVQLLLIG